MSDTAVYQPRIKISWIIGILVAFALFALIAAYSARMTQDYSDYDQDRAAQRYDTLKKLRQDEHSLIYPVDAQGHPGAVWADQDKGTVRISIDEAMVKEIDTLRGKPAAMGAAIPGMTPPAAKTPATPAPTAPAPGETNAAPAAPAPVDGAPTAAAAATQQNPASAPTAVPPSSVPTASNLPKK